MEVLKKTEGGFDLAAAEHVLCWHINTALQIVNALRFKGNVAPFAVETQASAFSFLLFFLLFAEVQIFCIDCKTIFPFVPETFRMLPYVPPQRADCGVGRAHPGFASETRWRGTCWCSCVPWESREDLGTHQEEEFLGSSFPWCIELCNCGGRRLPQNQEQEARHLQTEAWTCSGMHVPGECWPMQHWRQSRRRKGVGLDACSLRVVEEPNSLKPKVSF